LQRDCNAIATRSHAIAIRLQRECHGIATRFQSDYKAKAM
jgi:hypothetical protein